MQFVGNPYVWGGNSLTNGVDCSGFVHEVYAHFGISTPRYSQAFKSVGQAVSFDNIQPGDVVVYPGPVSYTHLESTFFERLYICQVIFVFAACALRKYTYADAGFDLIYGCKHNL